MLGSEILDIALGLALVFLLVSLIASAIREAIETWVKARAVHLERGIRELLDDPKGTGLARAFYEHPGIYPLFNGPYVHKEVRRFGGSMPTYIPARNFAVTVIDLAVRGRLPAGLAAMQTSPEITVAAVREGAGRMRSAMVSHAILMATDHAKNVNDVMQNLQAWYDSVMDRVSGRYKRRTQFGLFFIGLGLAIVLNVNAIFLADHLATNKTLRQALAARAEAVVKDTSYQRRVRDTALSRADLEAIQADLTGLKLPIGLEQLDNTPEGQRTGAWYLRLVAGWLMTAFAVTLGAPFWFDMLNKFMVIRSTVKPHEKSPEEGSEDRQPKKAGPGQPATPSNVNINLAPSGAVAAAGATAAVITAAAAVAAKEPDDFAPNEWATGEPDEGLL